MKVSEDMIMNNALLNMIFLAVLGLAAVLGTEIYFRLYRRRHDVSPGAGVHPPSSPAATSSPAFQRPEGAAIVKVSFNLTRDDVDTLRAVAERRGWDMAYALRQAIATEKFYLDATADGSRILIESLDGRKYSLVLR